MTIETKFQFLNDKLNVGRLNTPIYKLERLSEYYGYNLYIKRDDTTGTALSGNKIRKLEYLFCEGISLGADTFITCGGTQSNHVRATAALARRLGYTPVGLLYGTEPEKPYDGNLLLDEMLDMEIYWGDQTEIWEYSKALDEIADEQRSKGRKPYIIPMGGSNATGSLGYFRAGLEIIEQEKELGVNFDIVFSPVGSGGTYAGLAIAKKLAMWDADMYGVNVAMHSDFYKDIVLTIVDEFQSKYGQSCEIARNGLKIIDGYVGPGYAISTPEEMELIRFVARSEGIFLDPVYTGKAYWAMDDFFKSGKIDKGANILYLHTGGMYGLFPQRKYLSK